MTKLNRLVVTLFAVLFVLLSARAAFAQGCETLPEGCMYDDMIFRTYVEFDVNNREVSTHVHNFEIPRLEFGLDLGYDQVSILVDPLAIDMGAFIMIAPPNPSSVDLVGNQLVIEWATPQQHRTIYVVYRIRENFEPVDIPLQVSGYAVLRTTDGPPASLSEGGKLYSFQLATPSSSDLDGDGITNAFDNCTLVQNSFNENANSLNVQAPNWDFIGNICDGDLTGCTEAVPGDGSCDSYVPLVNVTDFGIFAGCVQQQSQPQNANTPASMLTHDGTPTGTNCGEADMNSSGLVNVTDHVYFLNQYFQGVAGPSGNPAFWATEHPYWAHLVP